ncbi:MAG TPA: LamG-like jellyroll fold domain-containing protein [Verrucomicrobiae bacterium]|nr:LamG-like jellyroll fold domain-containing protein [Verrucomicrobiae bacterium]
MTHKEFSLLANLPGSVLAQRAACLLALCLASSAFTAPLLNFPFNEGSGMTTTDSVGGVSGIFGIAGDPATGPAWTNDTPGGMAGDYALAFNLDNPPVRQRVDVDLTASPLVLGANNTNYTLQAWVKLPTRLNTDRMVIYRTSGPGPRVSLSIHHNRALHTTVYGNTDFVSSVFIPNDNRWHHIAAVMENNYGSVRFHLDGISRQTINRTATGAATDSVPTSLLIGMESDTRYFIGALDRVRIDDTALVAAELDYPAVQGRATLTAIGGPFPTNVVADIGSTVSFQASPTGINGRLDWRHRARLADPGGRDLPDAAMALPRVILTNVTAADRGFYSLVVSNSSGVAESFAARLDVHTAPGILQPLWALLPGERPYLTGWNTSAALRDLERGMAYNPVTGHLLIGARTDSPTIKGIYIVDAQTGAHIGELSGASAVTGGTIVLTRVVVADDGAIYACNFGTLSDANPLKIYRWASETAAAPTLAYEGNPVSGIAGNQQWGKNMIARRSGANTQILMDTRTAILGLFTTSDGENFTPTIIQSDAFDDATVGLAWGEGETFWGKNANESLYQWDLDAVSQTATMKRAYPDFPGDTFMNFSFSEDRRYLAGLKIQTGPDAVELYDVSNLTNQPVLLDSALFTPDNDHTVNYGNVLVVSNRVFALNPNNGVAAFTIVPGPGPNPSLTISLPGNGVIAWPVSFRGFVLETTDSLTSPGWAPVPHQVVGDQNTASVEPVGASRFYRLRK